MFCYYEVKEFLMNELKYKESKHRYIKFRLEAAYFLAL